MLKIESWNYYIEKETKNNHTAHMLITSFVIFITEITVRKCCYSKLNFHLVLFWEKYIQTHLKFFLVHDLFWHMI
jgi:hypothetical protein